jgi:transcriptional regulator with XRE-family HTH domain
MPLAADQRRRLADFLRGQRERLTAADLGLHAGASRRRTPGLRREEVAQLCGISPTWYTWLEQARDISVSSAALARLAEAFRLSPAERAYLFALAQKRDPAGPVPPPEAAVPAGLKAAVAAITSPCYLLDRLWNARAWNAPAERLFVGWLGGPERCLLAYVFLDTGAPAFIHDWEHRADRVVAEFRADTARYPDDPGLQALIERLRSGSAVFAHLWDRHAVLAREGGERSFNHPDEGLVLYRQLTFIPAGEGDFKLVMLLGPAAV